MPRAANGQEPRLTPAAGIAVAATAILCVLLAYGQTLTYGFRYDDYHLLRPWTTAELLQVTHGSWDPTHIEVSFYRPLTAWWYALQFQLFDLDAVPQHAISIAGMAACAYLAGLVAWREIRSARAAVIAAVLYAVHPSLVYPQGAWLTDQMHLLASLLVLSALLAWQRARTRSTIEWWPVFVLQVAAFGVKEDTLMLVPLLVGLTVLRWRLVGDVPRPTWRVMAAGAMLVGGLLLFRHAMLGALGGYGGIPSLAQGWENLQRGPASVLGQQPASRPWQPAARLFSLGTLVLGGMVALLRPRRGYLFFAGLLIMACVNLPLFIVARIEQFHLITLGAVLVLTGALESLLGIASIRALRWGLGAAAACGALAFLLVTRDITRDFEPCSASVARTDVLATEWWAVPPEIQAWLRAKPDACRAGTLVPLKAAIRSATWAYGGGPDQDGQIVQWTGDHATTLVTPRATALIVAVQRPNVAATGPVAIHIQGPQSTSTIDIRTPEWHYVTVPLTSTPSSGGGRMHRVRFRIAPVFVPAVVDPGSADRRGLGVLLRVEEVILPENLQH